MGGGEGVEGGVGPGGCRRSRRGPEAGSLANCM